MSPDRLRQIESIYHQVLDQPEDHRQSWLELHCDGDNELRREVESLLHEDGNGLLRQGALEAAATMQPMQEAVLAVGTKLNQYEIRSLLGTGSTERLTRADRIPGYPRSYDLIPGTNRFIARVPSEALINPHPEIQVVLNWLDALLRRQK